MIRCASRLFFFFLRLHEGLPRSISRQVCAATLQVGSVAATIPVSAVTTLLVVLAQSLSSTPHFEFVLSWLRALCIHHGGALQSGSGSTSGSSSKSSSCAPALRAVQQAVTRLHDDLRMSTDENLYALRFLCAAPETRVPSYSG